MKLAPATGFWRQLLRTIANNPISFFAVFCVMASAGYLAFITDRLVDVLESPQWCGNAIQAEKISPGNSFKGLESCLETLKTQVEALAMGLHISLATYALVLIVLVVVVVAGAKANFKLGKDGIEGNVSRDAKEAADQVAGAAVNEAETINNA